MPRKKTPPADSPRRRGGRKPAGKEARTQFSMLLNEEERAMIRILRLHYGVDGDAATVRQAVLRAYRALDSETLANLQQLLEQQ